jgi:hypothetical protein
MKCYRCGKETGYRDYGVCEDCEDLILLKEMKDIEKRKCKSVLVRGGSAQISSGQKSNTG